MKLEDALKGIKDAEGQLSTREAITNPVLISEQMYRLGQYASALEQFLGETEEEYETNWAQRYTHYTQNHKRDGELLQKAMSATAAKQQADVELAALKGNIKKLQRYVSAAWHVHMSCMARMKHLEAESRGAV